MKRNQFLPMYPTVPTLPRIVSPSGICTARPKSEIRICPKRYPQINRKMRECSIYVSDLNACFLNNNFQVITYKAHDNMHTRHPQCRGNGHVTLTWNRSGEKENEGKRAVLKNEHIPQFQDMPNLENKWSKCESEERAWCEKLEMTFQPQKMGRRSAAGLEHYEHDKLQSACLFWTLWATSYRKKITTKQKNVFGTHVK